MIKPIPEAVNVKKAILLHDTDANKYTLIHYDTEILSFNENKEIIKALQCSVSSTKAIYQVADYFGITREAIKKVIKPYSDFYKYPAGN
jgi:DNA-binding phage protein